MASKVDSVIRLGDRVRILTPEVVERVGYPRAVTEYRPDEKSPAYAKVVELVRLVDDRSAFFQVESPLISEILDAIQYRLAKKDNFGGRKRSVHTKLVEAYRGQEGVVVGRRLAQTGIYYSAWGNHEDVEPAGLSDRKTEILITVRCVAKGDVCLSRTPVFLASSLEKVKE